MEFIGAGIPMIAFPHFGDQHANARLLTDQKASVELYNVPAKGGDIADHLTRESACFDQAKVIECFNKVLND